MIRKLIERYPLLEKNIDSIESAVALLCNCFREGGKMLIAGNGGSCADADHIVGELMKSFKRERPIPAQLALRLKEIDPKIGNHLAESLQRPIPAISLSQHPALNTAFLNDVPCGSDLLFAQQLYGLGEPGDVFFGITTSGNSANVINAAVVAKAKGLKVIALTGESGGLIKSFADVCIMVPESETYLVQELHLPVYHFICSEVEDALFNE